MTYWSEGPCPVFAQLVPEFIPRSLVDRSVDDNLVEFFNVYVWHIEEKWRNQEECVSMFFLFGPLVD